MNKYAIIVAGGTGSRMGAGIPKQFMLLAGKPVLMFSIEAFYNFDPSIHIIVSLHPEFKDDWLHYCEKYSFRIDHEIIAGGETRFHSVRNALTSISSPGFVSVHDAARPLVSVELIGLSFAEAAIYSNAIPGIPVNETVRSIQNDSVHLLDRTNLRIIQTPQTFEIGLLKKAYLQDFRAEFTDDASLLERMGERIHVFPGDTRNLKITLPGDLQIAELWLR